MIRILKTLILITLISSTYLASAQSDPEVETWYVWIDTEVIIDGQSFRLVSDSPVTITCCVKSPKYRKFIKKTSSWISKNVSESYDLENGTKKIQDLNLANQMITEAKTSDNVKIIDYQASCI